MASKPTPPSDTDERVYGVPLDTDPYREEFGDVLFATVDPYAEPDKNPFNGDGFVGVSEYYRNYATPTDQPLDGDTIKAAKADGETGAVPKAPQAPAAPSRGDISNEQEGVEPASATDKK
jgi:hypothetical protein